MYIHVQIEFKIYLLPIYRWQLKYIYPPFTILFTDVITRNPCKYTPPCIAEKNYTPHTIKSLCTIRDFTNLINVNACVF